MSNTFTFKQSLLKNIILGGGVVAYPTEAVFGLGCDPFNPEAVTRISDIKQRETGKGYILIASSTRQIEWLLAPLPKKIRNNIQKTWPGPVTWLLPIEPGTLPWIHGDMDRIAVRVSSHPVVQWICNTIEQPLVSTSANRSGLQPAKSVLQIHKQFHNEVDMVVSGRLGKLKRPTKIIDAITNKVIRA